MLSFDEQYAIHPEMLIFAPAIACFIFGCWLLRRNT
jgi:lipopolysaccharide export LptBFGC system permease protein LptF